VFNEKEAHSFAEKLGGKLEPFMNKEEELPDIKKFAKLAIFLFSKFNPENPPRIYVTLGPRGSLGVDGSRHVIYVSSFSKSGAIIHDTNACGDAYCAAIALLEWAKRHGGHPNITGVNFPDDPLAYAKEMQYFMAVATAAAYCKATNRRGRVYAADLKDLLEHNHLASSILRTIQELADMKLEDIKNNKLPDCIDKDFRLREPSEAKFPKITEDLSKLIG
jgi:sugar/nucleoside kinase (ribokinase family)